jgi:hypothetical protein
MRKPNTAQAERQLIAYTPSDLLAMARAKANSPAGAKVRHLHVELFWTVRAWLRRQSRTDCELPNDASTELSGRRAG